MILYVRDDVKGKVVIENETFSFNSLKIILKKDGFFINDYRFRIRQHMQVSDIHFYFYDDLNYDHYKKYEMKERIEISSNGDIITDHFTACIDIRNMVLNSVFEEKLLKDKVYEIHNLRFLIHEDFIMINDVYPIHLIPYKQYPIIDTLNRQMEADPVYNVIPFKKVEYAPIKLKMPLTKENYDPIPVKYMLIPSLMMSFASLCNGIIMAYNALINGRKIIEIVPMLIMPIMMLFSNVFVIPLQRKYEKSKHFRKQRNREEEFKKYLEEMDEVIRKENQNYRNALLENYGIISSCRMNQDTTSINVLLGRGKTELPMDLDVLDLSKSDVLYPLYRSFLNAHMMMDSCIMINVLDYETIELKEEALFYLVLHSICCSYDPEHLHMGLVCDKKWFYEHSDLLYIPHFYKNNHRLVSFHGSLKDNEADLIFNVSNNMIILSSDNQTKRKAFISKSDIKDNTGYHARFEIMNDDYHLSYVPYKEKDEVSIYTLLNIGNIDDFDIHRNWMENKPYISMSVPIGCNDTGKIMLDINEKGNGPHGVFSGTTGSGKSEMIISWILAMSLTFSYEMVNFVLIDFKGGGLIQTFRNTIGALPHLSGVITNLDKTEIRRCLIGLNNECIRRQKLFTEAADMINEPSMNIDLYEKSYSKSWKLPMISHLIILIDEFAELKAMFPDFIKELVSIARIGRSLGIHLVVSTQKAAGIIDQQIWSNMRFRISLKVWDKEDSKAMIETDDALFLLNPGDFILYTDGKRSKGSSGYAQYSKDYHEHFNKVCLLDEKGNIIKQKQIAPFSKEKMSTAILKKIISYSQGHRAQALWCDPLDQKTLNKIVSRRTEGLLLGVLDDIYNGKQYDYYKKTGNMLFVAEHDDKQDYLRFMLNNLIETIDPYKEHIVFIDTEKQFNLKCPGIEVISDEERICNCFKPFNKRLIIIILNFSLFLKMYPDLYDKCLDILTNPHFMNKNIYGFIQMVSEIPSKMIAAFKEKIVIGKCDKNDLYALFNNREALEIETNRKHGIAMNKHLCKLYYPLVNDDMIREKLEQYRYKDLTFGNIRIMDEHLRYEVQDSLFKSYDDYEWISIRNKKILITGAEDKYLEEMKQILSKHNFMNIEVTNVSSLKRTLIEFDMILWIGKGYAEQYYIPVNKKIRLNKYDAVLYVNDKVEKVRLIEA